MTVTQYLNAIKDPRRKKEMKHLHKLIREIIPDQKPAMWARDTILGYGAFPYKTKSGCEGTWFPMAISSRAAYISLYGVGCHYDQDLIKEYGGMSPKMKAGRACINIKNLDGFDEKVFKRFVKDTAKYAPKIFGSTLK